MVALIRRVIMKELKEFTIPFIGLKLGEHLFDYQIDNKFFEHFEESLVENGKVVCASKYSLAVMFSFSIFMTDLGVIISLASIWASLTIESASQYYHRY